MHRLAAEQPAWKCAAAALVWAVHASCMAAAPAAFDFAVVANMPAGTAQEPAVQGIFQAIARDPKVEFIVHDGALKSADEPCDDARLEQRLALLSSSATALIYVPGANDWATCSSTAAGGYDPLGRLDLIRQMFFVDATSLGQNSRPVERQSEIAKFRQFRENVRWEINGVMFIALNLPSDNNHYSSAGGRNGEFEDRMVANLYWLDHGLEYARRRGARAIVVFVQGAPNFEPVRRRNPGAFDWLNFSGFGHANERDGYREFKQKMFSLSEAFSGPVVLIDSVDTKKASGFRIDQPLPPPHRSRDAKAPRRNLTQIELSTNIEMPQWLQVHVQHTGEPLFRLSMHTAKPAPARDAQAAGSKLISSPDSPPTQPSSVPSSAASSALPSAPLSAPSAPESFTPNPPALLPLAPPDISAPRIPGMPASTGN